MTACGAAAPIGAPGSVPAQIRRARVSVQALFAVLGLAAGSWASRIPAVKENLRLSDGSLGVALLAAPAGVVLVVLVAGRIVDRSGSSRPAWLSGVALPLVPVTMALARNMAELMAALLVYGVAVGMLDVSMNAQAVRVERAYQRPLMSSFHACFSFGVLAGAVSGGLFAWARVAPAPSFAAIGLTVAAAALIAGRALLDGPDTPAAGEPDDPGRGPVRRAQAEQRLRVIALVAALSALAFCSALGEGAVDNWSAVYLRDNLSVPEGLAPIGLAVFSITMACGRLLGDRLAARLGPVRLVRGCGLLAAAGLAAGLLSRSAAGAVAGFALFGAGLSCTFPQLLSAAGRADQARPGGVIARVVGAGYVGILTGPVVIGGCATLSGLPLALGIPAVLAGIIGASAGVLRSRGGGPGAA